MIVVAGTFLVTSFSWQYGACPSLRDPGWCCIFLFLFSQLPFWLSVLFKVPVSSLLISRILPQLLSSKYTYFFLCCPGSSLWQSHIQSISIWSSWTESWATVDHFQKFAPNFPLCLIVQNWVTLAWLTYSLVEGMEPLLHQSASSLKSHRTALPATADIGFKGQS